MARGQLWKGDRMLPNLSSFYDRALWNPFLETAQRDFNPTYEVQEKEDG